MVKYNVTGMSCAACSARVEKAVSAVEGVTSCSVNLLMNSMGVEGSAQPAAVIAAVEQAGYGASLADADGAAAQAAPADDPLEDKQTPAMKRRLFASLVFLAALMYLSMFAPMLGLPLPPFLADNAVSAALAQLLLTSIIMVINQRFFISGFKGVIHRAPNMDTLVALGASAAFVYSVYAMFVMSAAQGAGDAETVAAYSHELYFESAGMILTLITLGKLLEAHSKGKTTNALKSLMKLSPKTARLIQNGEEVIVPAERVKVGDIFAVKTGDSIPTDGVVIEGFCAVDESALTGESVPVDKAPGDEVSAATLSRAGYVRCSATRVGKDTALSQIIRMVSDAAATKAPIAKIADKVSGVFVPAVIAIAIAAALAWLALGKDAGFALERGISVLVISCPCALGLATPVAIMVGSGLGAKHGILFKTAAALEETGKAQFVILDKTGTITRGEPSVTDILPSPEITEEELISTAFSLEKRSEHPLAKAIMEYAAKNGAREQPVDSFEVLRGSGISARIGGREHIAGNLRLAETYCDIPVSMRTQCDELSEQGKTPMFFCRDKSLLGVIAVSDTIKEDSADAIKRLKGMGIKTVMLTGDNERTARAIGAAADVDEVIAGVLPDGKEAVVKGYCEQGKTIMVGDGINDAPALTRADIGIAIGAGADVAIDAADVVLMKSRLSDAAAAIALSRKTLGNIRQNLFWAFFYNIIGIPLAAGLWIPLFGWRLSPSFGALAMSLSSFCVVTNALRLNLARIYPKGYHAQSTEISGETPIDNTTTEVHQMEVTMNIEGIMCGHCEATVKKTLEAVAGVISAEVSHESGTAVVKLAEGADKEALKKAVEDKDYKVVSMS